MAVIVLHISGIKEVFIPVWLSCLVFCVFQNGAFVTDYLRGIFCYSYLIAVSIDVHILLPSRKCRPGFSDCIILY